MTDGTFEPGQVDSRFIQSKAPLQADAMDDAILQRKLIDQFPTAPEGADRSRRISREQVLEIRRMEREGVPFWLENTGIEATVKALSFADRTLLSGIPSHLQQDLAQAFNTRPAAQRGRNTTFSDMLRNVGNDERIANIVCVAGFVWPPLVMTEAELADNPESWVVTDLHIDERRKYMGLVLGTEEAETARIAGFLSDRVANSSNS